MVRLALTWLWVLATAALGVVAFRHLRESPPPAERPLRLTLPEPPGAIPGSGDEPFDAAISPDGRTIVSVATSEGMARLWLLRLDTGRAEPLRGTERAAQPAWKHTGRVVVFFADGRLRQLSLTDGEVRDLAAVDTPAGASWLPDGSLLFASGTRGPILRLSAGTQADATTLRAGDRQHQFPVATGRGSEFVYTAVRADGRRFARLAAEGADRELVETSGHAALVDDHLLYVRDGVLLAQRFNRETGTLEGRAQPIAFDVGVSAGGRAFFAASRRLLLTANAASRAREIAWLDLVSGARVATTGEPGDYWQVRVAPDDAFVAVTMVAPLLRTIDIFRVPVLSGPPLRMTSSLFADTDPVWAPDGRALLFRSLANGRPNMFVRRTDPHDAASQPLGSQPADGTPTDWSGDRILFHQPGNGTGLDVWTAQLRTGERRQVTSDGFNESDARWSPDGGWIAYVSDESGRPEIYARRWPRGDRVRVSFGGGARPRWTRDGRAIVFVRNGQLVRAERDPAEPTSFRSPTVIAAVDGIRDLDLAHRSDRAVVLLPSPNTVHATIRAIGHWQSALTAEAGDRSGSR